MGYPARWVATCFLALGLSGASGATGAHAGEITTSASASLGVYSSYVWRGVRLSEGAVLQPAVSLNYGGLGAGMWANHDLETGELNETDLTLSYAGTLGPVSLGGGYLYYGLDGLEDTQELFLTAGAEVPLHPSVTIYYDFDSGEGAFITAALSEGVALPAGFSFKLWGTASYCAGDRIMGLAGTHGYHGFYNGELAASLLWKRGPFTVEPRIAYSFPLSGGASRILETLSIEGDDRILYGGANISLGF